jgi:hypothetical protein
VEKSMYRETVRKRLKIFYPTLKEKKKGERIEKVESISR